VEDNKAPDIPQAQNQKIKNFRAAAVNAKKKRKRKTNIAGNIGGEKIAACSALTTNEKRLEIFIIAILLALGVYHSILYFGHQVVPNPDFPGFVRVGHQLLSFQLPSSYKRAPGVGLLQAALSHLVKGQHPDLTAGWLLNAILHPFNIVLLWLVGKRIVGRAALWVAVIAIINPWTIQLLTEPIAETTLLFFVLLTFYFIFKRSSFSYLFASITTMIRYEGAALILAAFAMDMISRKTKKEKVRAFIYSAIASVPLMLWMLGTVLAWKSQSAVHYLKFIKDTGEFAFFEFISLIWQMGFYPLLLPTPTTAKETADMILTLSKILVAGSFAFGVIYGLLKRRWEILAFMIFLLPYLLIHAIHSVVIPRYCVPIYWIVLLVCLFGLQNAWKLINKDNRVPKPIVIALQVLLLISAFVWLILLVPYLPKIAPISRQSASIPYVTIAVVAVIFAALRFTYKAKHSWRDLIISVLVCLMIVSNQFSLARMVGTGQRNIEFKRLADWYIDNAKPGEKLLSTMANVARIFAPQHKDSLLDTGIIKAENPSDFAKKCLDENITYIAWDSRMGLSFGGFYYELWGLKNITMLIEPRSIGPYEFVTQIRISKNRFINIFRLRKTPPPPPSQ